MADRSRIRAACPHRSHHRASHTLRPIPLPENSSRTNCRGLVLGTKPPSRKAPRTLRCESSSSQPPRWPFHRPTLDQRGAIQLLIPFQFDKADAGTAGRLPSVQILRRLVLMSNQCVGTASRKQIPPVHAEGERPENARIANLELRNLRACRCPTCLSGAVRTRVPAAHGS
jgi:hypothetical protein